MGGCGGPQEARAREERGQRIRIPPLSAQRGCTAGSSLFADVRVHVV